MPDERPLLSPEEAIAALQKELEDLKTTISARMLREPIGKMDWTTRSTPMAGTLFCQGQTLDRGDYPELWDWVVKNGQSPLWYGAGNGTTTFTLPDLRDRFPLGASAARPLGTRGGSLTKTLATANMPAHDHNVGVDSVGGHTHGRSGGNRFTNEIGDHGGHCSGSANVVPPGAGVSLPSFYNNGNGGHNHTVAAGDSSGGHDHGVTESTVGNGTAFDIMPPYFAVNYYVWF